MHHRRVIDDVLFGDHHYGIPQLSDMSVGF